MTGYATGLTTARQASSASDQTAHGAAALGLEIRAVNSRFLDLSLRLPEALRSAEPALRERVAARVRRGKVEVRAWVEQRASGSVCAPSAADLQRLLRIQTQVQAWLPQARGLSVADILQLTQRTEAALVDWMEPLLALTEKVLDDLTAARAREGDRLAASLLERVALLRALVEQAGPLVPQVVAQQRERFLQRVHDALGSMPADPAALHERALAEAAAFAVRVDVAEELTRLQSHLSEIEQLLQRGGEVGKRLDFLLQELHREANTLGAKSAALELTRLALDMKVLIEQMREQVQNLE